MVCTKIAQAPFRNGERPFHCSRNYVLACSHRKAEVSGVHYTILVMEVFGEYNCQASKVENLETFSTLNNSGTAAVRALDN